LAVAAVAAGCSSKTEVPTADIDGMDVLVSPTSVTAFVDFVDPETDAHVFPPLTDCATLSTGDDNPVQTCLSSIMIGSDQLVGTTNPYGMDRATAPGSTPMLLIDDCGIEVSVPLTAPSAFPTLTGGAVKVSGNTDVVSWTTAAPATLVEEVGSNDDYACLAPASPYTFEIDPTMSPNFEVTPFEMPVATQTDLGEIRVWYAGARMDVGEP
jgi:hypothetical protein